APTPQSSESHAGGIDRAADRAADRVQGNGAEGEPFRLHMILELLPGHPGLRGYGPAVRVQADNPVHPPHVEQDAPAVRDGPTIPAGAPAPRRDREQALIAQLDEGGDLLARLR